MVAGEIRELTNLLNLRNKNQEKRKHIWEIAEILFRFITGKNWWIAETIKIEKEPNLIHALV